MSATPVLLIDQTQTPIGLTHLISDEQGALRAVFWDDYLPRLEALLTQWFPRGYRLQSARDHAGFTSALNAYMDGELSALDNLRVKTSGTPFQEIVWRALRQIPVGTAISYGELARRIGNASASRAVGLANGANPVGIVIPCHRVIGANRALTGYGGGLHRKRWLLEHEGCNLQLRLTGT